MKTHTNCNSWHTEFNRCLLSSFFFLFSPILPDYVVKLMEKVLTLFFSRCERGWPWQKNSLSNEPLSLSPRAFLPSILLWRGCCCRNTFEVCGPLPKPTHLSKCLVRGPLPKLTPEQVSPSPAGSLS